MSRNTWWGKTLRFIGIVLMALTAGFTLLGGIGTTCAAAVPDEMGKHGAPGILPMAVHPVRTQRRRARHPGDLGNRQAGPRHFRRLQDEHSGAGCRSSHRRIPYLYVTSSAREIHAGGCRGVHDSAHACDLPDLPDSLHLAGSEF